MCCEAGTHTWQSQRGRRETWIHSCGSHILGYIQSHVVICPHSPSTPGLHSHCVPCTHTHIGARTLHADNHPIYLRQTPHTHTTHSHPPVLKTPQPSTAHAIHPMPIHTPPSLPRRVQEQNKSPVPIPTSSLSSPPPGVQSLCPPAAEPKWESRQKTRVKSRAQAARQAGKRASRLASGRHRLERSLPEQQFRVPGRGRGQVSTKYLGAGFGKPG